MSSGISDASAPAAVATASPRAAWLRPSDLFVIGLPAWLGVLLALQRPARGSAAFDACAAYLAVAMFGIACRYFGAHSERRVLRLSAHWYVVPTLWVTYWSLNPVVDLAAPVPFDRILQATDLALFGTHPAVALQRFAHPWFTEIALYAYSAFFLWQVGLGVVLYRRGNGDFDDYVLTAVLFYVLSFASYAVNPAIGPRFALAESFSGPLSGPLIGTGLAQSFNDVPMLRDCFPSGHTGLTLLTLFWALRKRAYRFFWVMLPCALLLIFSTLYCRFHYAIDLLAALPFSAGILALQAWIQSLRPGAALLPGPRSGRLAP